MADPQWLEILKASGGQALAAAGACGALLVAAHWQWIPPLDPWVIHSATFGLVLGGMLFLVSFLSALNSFFTPRTWIVHWVQQRRERKDAEGYIEHMTEKERAIIAYLLHHKQKMFTCASDGGYAATLISRGIIVCALRPGQGFATEDMPVAVPDHIWKILAKNSDRFPYEVSPDEDQQPYPWRVPWKVR